MWQEIIVGLCILAALIFVLYQYLPVQWMPHYRKKAGDAGACGGCNGCSTKKGCH